MTTSNRVTKVFFWIAFSAFLVMSIPHVAFVFHFYEPKNDGYGVAWWIVSYGVAIGIDMLICWLSYTRAEIENATRFDGFVTWVFIFLLAVLSWFCNWLFAEIMIGVNIWQNTVPFIGWTVGNFTPVIVSAIPMFLIAYTYMSKRILNAKAQTVDDLDKEIERLTGIKGRQEQLRELRKGTGFIAGVTRIAKDTKKAVIDVIDHDVHKTEKDRDTGPIVNPHVVENLADEHEQNKQNDVDLEDKNEQQNVHSELTNDTPGEVPIVDIQKTQKASVNRQGSNASERVHKVLKSNPSATVTQIVDKAKVSRGYASQIRKQWLSEQMQSA